MKEKFQDFKFSAPVAGAIQQICRIVEEYDAQGYDLSARQIHYQFVSRNLHQHFPEVFTDTDPKSGARTWNNGPNVKRMEGLISDARMAGLIDWDAIKDRNRVTECVGTWPDMASYLQALNQQYRRSKWTDQPAYVEVMVEKQAAEGILLPICNRWEVPFTANKGYASQSLMYARGKYLQSMRDVEKKEVHVIYLGDHDPSGIDMSRDILDRLAMFSDGPLNLHRIALNRDQVDQWELPENPAKLTDSRAASYIERFGETSWELDAIPPAELVRLLDGQIRSIVNQKSWDAAVAKQNEERGDLQDFIEMSKGGDDE